MGRRAFREDQVVQPRAFRSYPGMNTAQSMRKELFRIGSALSFAPDSRKLERIVILDLDQFVFRERPFWDELTLMLERQEKQPGLKLSLEEARRFHYLYQRASSDLVKLKTFAGEVEVSRFLENLVARSYSRLHEKRGARLPFRPLEWLLRTFPSTFRRHVIAFLVASSAFLAGGLFGCGVMATAPQHKMQFLGGFTHLAGSPSDRVAKEEKEAQSDRGLRERADHTFASLLMANNIRVAMLAMALGFLLGVPSLMLLFYNGVILGIVCFDYIADGQGLFLIAWLLPHGSVEIPAILLGGQAGMIIAHAMIGWGTNLRLAQRFRRIRSDLLTIAGGASLLLVAAGVVESFLSQRHGPQIYPVKILFGCFLLAVLIFWLAFAGRKGKVS